MSITDITAVIIAVSGIAGTYTAYRLGQRGQHNDEKQQTAATKLQTRISAFDELESLNDRLKTENERLRDLYSEAETKGDLRVATQARRCRSVLDETMAALSILQSVVISEMAQTAASDVESRAKRHIAEDHGADEGDN